MSSPASRRFIRSFPFSQQTKTARFIVAMAMSALLICSLPTAASAGPVMDPRGGLRIIGVKPGKKPAPKLWSQLVASPNPQGSPLPVLLVPPLEGPIMSVAINVTDQRQGDFDIIATAQTGLSGSLLSGHTTNVIYGLLDSGASTHLVSYPDSVASGLQGYLTGNTTPVGGVGGSADLDVSQPVGFFVHGLQTNPPSNSLLGLGNFSALVNSDYNYSQGINPPTVIGAPFLLYYPAYIRNSAPVPMQIGGSEFSSPSITFYEDPADPAIPVLQHKIFLETRPTGDPVVAYFILLDENPIAPSTILAGLSASALFFTASSMTLSNNGATSSGKMVVDTGAQATLISEIAAAELDLDVNNPDFTIEVQGIVDSTTAPGFYLDAASIPALGGTVRWSDVPVVVLNVGSPEGGTLYGIFGNNLTANRDQVFNGAASTPYLAVTDPNIQPRMQITAIRNTGLATAEIDWHAEPAPPFLWLERCTNLGTVPANWSPVLTNNDGTINGTLSFSNFVPRTFYRLATPQ